MKLVHVCLAAMLLAAPAARASAERIFYNISTDPHSLELLALSDINGEGKVRTMEDINVFQSPQMMLGSTWRFDCAGGRMAIIHTTQVQPGSPVNEANVSSASIKASSSPKSKLLFQLVCTGKGDLHEQHASYTASWSISSNATGTAAEPANDALCGRHRLVWSLSCGMAMQAPAPWPRSRPPSGRPRDFTAPLGRCGTAPAQGRSTSASAPTLAGDYETTRA